jgi:hypothetical protein
MMQQSLYHEPNWRFRFTNWNIHYRILFSTLDYATLKRLSGATDLDMYWISAAAFALLVLVENQHKFHCIPGCQMRWQVLLLFQH